MLMISMGTSLATTTAFDVPPESAAKTQEKKEVDYAKNVVLVAPLDDFLPAALWIRIGVRHPVTGKIIDYEWKLNTCAAGDRSFREDCYRGLMRSVYVEVSPRHPGLNLASFGLTMPITFTGSRVRTSVSKVSNDGLSSVDPAAGSPYTPDDPPYCEPDECGGGGGGCMTVVCDPAVCGPRYSCGSTCLNCLF
jgi:hypothetical protein